MGVKTLALVFRGLKIRGRVLAWQPYREGCVSCGSSRPEVLSQGTGPQRPQTAGVTLHSLTRCDTQQPKCMVVNQLTFSSYAVGPKRRQKAEMKLKISNGWIKHKMLILILDADTWWELTAVKHRPPERCYLRLVITQLHCRNGSPFYDKL